MLVNSSIPGIDEFVCATAGNVGARVFNELLGKTVISPIHGSLFFGGTALASRLFEHGVKKVLPERKNYFSVQIPIKKMVTYGCAIYTTLKVMQIAGMILIVPPIAQAIGALSFGALAIGALAKGISHYIPSQSKDTDETESEKKYLAKTDVFETFVKGKEYINDVFTFKVDDETFKVRIIRNPNRKNFTFPDIKFKKPGEKVAKPISSDAYYIVIAPSIEAGDAIEKIFEDHDTEMQLITFTDIDKGKKLLVKPENKAYETYQAAKNNEQKES